MVWNFREWCHSRLGAESPVRLLGGHIELLSAIGRMGARTRYRDRVGAMRRYLDRLEARHAQYLAGLHAGEAAGV